MSENDPTLEKRIVDHLHGTVYADLDPAAVACCKRLVTDTLGGGLSRPPCPRCTGVECAFADLSRSISGIRARELAAGAKDVVVTCPI